MLDNMGDDMSWHAESTEGLEDCNTTGMSITLHPSTQIEKYETSKESIENDLLHNTETELRDHPFQENNISPIKTNDPVMIINKEKDEDTTEVFPINDTVKIPSMLKTQMLLDEQYLGRGTFSKNMSLKIKKKNKAVTKRNKVSKNTKKVIKQQPKSNKKGTKTSKKSKKACSKKDTTNKTAAS